MEMLGKLKFYLIRATVFLMPLALIVGLSGFDCNGGGQTPPSQNLEIRTWYDLDQVRHNLAGNHTLMNDLDSSSAGYEELASPRANQGKGWEPIGTTLIQKYGLTTFVGTFDGQGYEIRALCINRPDEDAVGLFGYVGQGGVIKDMDVVNATVTGGQYAGVFGIVSLGGRIEDIGVVNATVTGDYYVGGLAGWNLYGTVSGSYSSGSVTGSYAVGGLVGAIDRGTVSNSYYNYDESLINGENMVTVGALCGEDFEEWLDNDKSLDINERLHQENGYCVVDNVNDFRQLLAFGQDATLKFRLTNDLDLAGEPDFYIPYLAGEFDGNGHEISNLSCNLSSVSPVGLFGYLASGGEISGVGVESVDLTGAVWVGGLVGQSFLGTVRNCYSTGSVTTGDYGAGGLVGCNEGTVSESYSACSVTGDWRVGGLVGCNEGIVSNSYSTGRVTGNSFLGGLVGQNYESGAVVNSSFWDTETSGQAASEDGTGTGKTTAEMRSIATFSSAGWNIIAVVNPGVRNPSHIWNIVDGQTYPFLSWQPVS
jgi:mucin-19